MKKKNSFTDKECEVRPCANLLSWEAVPKASAPLCRPGILDVPTTTLYPAPALTLSTANPVCWETTVVLLPVARLAWGAVSLNFSMMQLIARRRHSKLTCG